MNMLQTYSTSTMRVNFYVYIHQNILRCCAPIMESVCCDHTLPAGFGQQSDAAHCNVMGIEKEQAHQGPRVVTAKLVEVSTDSKRTVQVAAGVQRTHGKVLPQKTMAMLAPDLSIHGEPARQTMQPAAVQRLGHEQKEATGVPHPCNSGPKTALPPVAVVVQASWVSANQPPAHPLEKHKKHVESTKLPWVAGVTECTLCCMDGCAPVVATP